MAKVEIPELTQALAMLTNETATVIAELKDIVQVVVFAIENVTVTVTNSMNVIQGSIPNVDLIAKSLVNTTYSLNRTISSTNQMIFYVMCSLCFMFISIGISYLVFALVFYLAMKRGHPLKPEDIRHPSERYSASDSNWRETRKLTES